MSDLLNDLQSSSATSTQAQGQAQAQVADKSSEDDKQPVIREQLPLGERLLERGVLSEDQLRIALVEQGTSGDPLGRVLIRMGFLTESILRDIFSESSDAETVDLNKVTVDPLILEKIPQDVAKRFSVFPISCDEDTKTLTVALVNPNDMLLLDQIRAYVGAEYELTFMVAEESVISRCIDEYYGLELSIGGILREIELGEGNEAATGYDSDGAESASHPIIRLVGAFLNDAVKRNASDIHFEPEESFLRVRYRIDGVLRQIRSLHRSYWEGMSVRLKVMSDMNIAESRAPQDGRISFTIYGRIVDFRVAAQPTAHGENFVLRILDQTRNISKIDSLGLNQESFRLVSLMLARPTGLILVTGPTGSGKTTTLYSFIQHMNSESVNVMTLEDPIEYPLPMIRQSAVTDGGKMDWSSGIRSILRQDPDIVLIGEMRDQETSVMAFRASMTGHLVLSTLHTNSAMGVFPRLWDMGISNSIMISNIAGIIAQRLVRKLCPQCKKKVETLTDDERKILSHVTDAPESHDIYEAVGCNYCEYQGYRGRFAIMEVLLANASVDNCLAEGKGVREIQDVATENKVFISMTVSGLEAVLDSKTSIKELSRVVNMVELLL